MKRALLLRLAAVLCLLTCLGHTVGTFMPIPAEQTALKETVEVMKRTMIPMPVGEARSYMQILDGNNLCTSLLLLLMGLLLFTLASAAKSPAVDRMTWIVALGLIGFSALSALYFFPVPVVFAGLAAALSIGAITRSEAAQSVDQ